MHLIEVTHAYGHTCMHAQQSLYCFYHGVSVHHSWCFYRYACSVENRGVSIKVNGLNEKLPVSLLNLVVLLYNTVCFSLQSLFKMVVDSVASFSTTQGDFDMIKVYTYTMCTLTPSMKIHKYYNSYTHKLLCVFTFHRVKEGLRRSYRNSDLDPETFCR